MVGVGACFQLFATPRTGSRTRMLRRWPAWRCWSNSRQDRPRLYARWPTLLFSVSFFLLLQMFLLSPCNMKHAFIVTTKVLCEGWGVALTRHCHQHATKVEKMQYVVIPFMIFFLSLNLLSASSLRNDQNFIDLFFFLSPSSFSFLIFLQHCDKSYDERSLSRGSFLLFFLASLAHLAQKFQRSKIV